VGDAAVEAFGRRADRVGVAANKTLRVGPVVGTHQKCTDHHGADRRGPEDLQFHAFPPTGTSMAGVSFFYPELFFCCIAGHYKPFLKVSQLVYVNRKP
jgi:hypothetical protein